MANTALGSLLNYLRRFHDHSAAEATDSELLRRHVGGDETAFAALLHRHAPMVWGVCRRLLANEQDAEDAFQASFLVLLRRAESLRVPQSLAAFLHGVASRIARKAQVTAQRRRHHEARAESPRPSDRYAVVEQRELRALLDEELDRLPEKYRAPLVLCYFEGMSYTEAARRLGWRDGTLCGRLARARELLRKRLTRRGVTLSGAALAAVLTEPAAAPAATVVAVSRMAVLFALGQGAPGSVSPPVATLAQGVLHAMTVAKLKTLAALGAVFCVLVGGGGLAAHRLLLVKEAAPERTAAPAAKESDLTRTTQAEHLDCRGDPLPPEAIARLGTTRFRHGYNVFHIAFCPDGTRLVSADWNGAHLWETATGRAVRRLGPLYQTSLRSLSLSGDGKTVALAEHHSGTIQILDVATGKLLRQFKNGPDNNDRFCAVSFSPNGKLLASYASKIIRLWSPATGKLLHQWQADPEQVHHIILAPDSKTLFSGGEDRTIRFWDTSTGKEVRRISDHPGPIVDLALSPDGKTLASLGSTKHESNLPGGSRGIMWLTDNKVHLWDTASGKKLGQLEALGPETKKGLRNSHPNAINQILFSPDGKTMVTAGQDRTVRIWDVNEGKELRRLEIPWATSFAFSRDGKILATGGVDKTVRLWDWTTGRELREQPGHRGGIHYLALSPDGHRIASASMDRTVRIWDAGSGRELQRLVCPEGEMAPVAFSANGRALNTIGVGMTYGGADKKGRVWDVATGKELRQLPDWTACSGYAVSADGRTYAFVVESKQISLWDAVAERKRPVRIEQQKGILGLAFSPDARKLFGWFDDRKMYVWDTATGKELHQLAVGAGSEVNAVAFSPDGRWLACAGRDQEIRLYDMSTGKEVHRLTGKSPFIYCLAFAPDGRTLAGSSMYEPTIYLWETASGQLRHRLTGHEGRIFKLLFSPDSKRLLSGSEDTTALLWDLIGSGGARDRVSALNLRTWWDELASADAGTAYHALRSMTAAAGPAVDFLRERLQPIPEPDHQRVARLIADLDHDTFARRDKAAKELENLGEAVEPALHAAHDRAASLETRQRTEALLAKLPDAERQTLSTARLRMLRAIEVLERIGTPEARELLRQLANGAAAARQTREAKAALQRLTSRRSHAP